MYLIVIYMMVNVGLKVNSGQSPPIGMVLQSGLLT